MKDIDRNINSYLYYVSNALNTFNDIRDLNSDKLKKKYIQQNMVLAALKKA